MGVLGQFHPSVFTKNSPLFRNGGAGPVSPSHFYQEFSVNSRPWELGQFLQKWTQGPSIFLILPLIRYGDFCKIDQKVAQNEGFYYYYFAKEGMNSCDVCCQMRCTTSLLLLSSSSNDSQLSLKRRNHIASPEE